MDSRFADLEPARTGSYSVSGSRFHRIATADTDQDAARRRRAAQTRTMDLEAAFFDDFQNELNPFSRAGFQCFMEYNRVAEPLLGAEPTGVLEATWQRGNECLSIRFNDRHRLSYAVSYRDAAGAMRRKWAESNLGSFFSDCPEAKLITSI
jgi:hypothetical protein